MGLSMPRSATDGITQRRGRFMVTALDADVEEAEQGSPSNCTNGVASAESASADSIAGEPVAQTEALHRLHAVLEAQNRAWTMMWQDMEQQVYHALLHDGTPQPHRSTRASTPPSAQSISSSSCRTPPCDNGSERRTGPKSGSSTASNCTVVASNSLQQQQQQQQQQLDNPRESTLRTWSHLGSTLKEVVCRNEQLDDENRRLRDDLDALQRQILDMNMALARAAPPGRQHSSSASGLPVADISAGGEFVAEMGQIEATDVLEASASNRSDIAT